MTETLGASVLVILAFFASLCTMLIMAVHMESTLQRPQSRHRRRGTPALSRVRRDRASTPPGSGRAHSRI
jgi:hypothetical protein